MRQRQRGVDRPAFVNAVEEAGREGVAGAVGAFYLGWRRVDRRPGADAPVAARDHRALGEVHDDMLHGARGQGRFRSADAGVKVGPPAMHRLGAGDTADLGVVDDEKVEVRKAGPHNRGEALGGDLASSRLVRRPVARAFLSVVTQPFASSFHGASIRRWMPGSPRWKMR